MFEKMSESIGPRIKQARDKAGLSQRDLADRAGVHNTTLGKWERNEAIPAADALLRLASILGTTSEYLLGYEATIFGYPLRHDWPPGLKEFVVSDLAAEMDLRPWEVAVLAALSKDGMAPRIGNWAAILLKWRVEHFDLTGIDPETVFYEAAQPE